ncbi:dynein heavy chain, partial [Thraustotheca clavata]
FVQVHLSIQRHADHFLTEFQRHVYITPKSYLDAIHLYLRLLAEKRYQVKEAYDRLSTGVVKLEDTNEVVAKLKVELTNLQPILAAKAIEAEALLNQVAVDQMEASLVEQRVSHDESIVKAQAQEVAECQADAQRDLDTAMPALNAAVQALDSLDKKDITEVKSFTKPPQAVQVVMEAVCIMLGDKPDWDTSKRLLSRPTFMQELKEYDKDNIPPKILKSIKKYIDNPEFAVEEVKKVSKAAMSLCMWIHAMDMYAKVIKEVGPKRERLSQMNGILAEANAKLSAKQAELNQVMERVRGLQAQCEQVVAEKKRLAAEAELTHARLSRAEKLTVGLADELIRWKASLEVMTADEVNLVGDVFLSAACIAYLGPFDSTYRIKLQELWHETIRAQNLLPISANPSLLTISTDSVQLREWNLSGLPTDNVSDENAVILFRGERWPLMIDPQQQARTWIHKMESTFGLEVVKLREKSLLKCIENCVRDARPLLIEGIDETLDPVLDPLLLKSLVKQGGKYVLKVGDREVLYDRNFRLYMITKLPNPHFLPDVTIKVNVINFTVTKEGLEDQLLGDVVRKEQPDVENKKNTLLASIATDQKLLKAIESKILSLLSASQGNILDDQVLINTLGESKKTSKVVSERLAESELTRVEISDIRNKYRSVSVRGSILYFVIADLATVDPMYQYSLEAFCRLFNQSLEETKTSNCSLNQRLEALIDAQTFIVYKNVCRGLFESHKLLFSLLMAVRIMLDAKSITIKELSLLRGVPVSISEESHIESTAMFPPRQYQSIVALSNAIPVMAMLPDSVMLFSEAWQQWLQSDNPFIVDLPDGFETKLSKFQKLVLVKTVREDRGVLAASCFIAQTLGTRFTKSPPFFMSDIYPDLGKNVPCIFILSAGADPTSILHRFAKELNKDDRLHIVSLGQGQGPVASALIERCAKSSGDWALLQNCHLAKSWMPQLEKLLIALKAEQNDVHEDFRLFLTSFPANYFPVSILQSSVKITNEPPKGIKPNLLRSYEMLITDKMLTECKQPEPWRKLIFGLCFFHAIVQERAKFGAMGWTKVYQFNDSDLETAIAVLRTFLDEQESIPWDALHYVTGEINYGGRVTDEFDRRCLLTNLKRFYSSTILTLAFSEHSPHYYAPPCVSLDEFHTFIDSLPNHDAPDIFGLHENANIVYQTQETKELFDLLLGLQSREDATTAAASDDGGDQRVLTLATQVESQLPQLLDRSSALSTTFQESDGQMDSLSTVLSQELDKFNLLISTVKSSVQGLQLAIKGLAVMSETLDAAYKSLLLCNVPEEWTKVSFASLKPLSSWLEDLIHRVAFMASWLRDGKPASYPLPVFFFPQGFLTGLLQNHARKHILPINALEFTFVIDPSELCVTDGAIVTGLYIEGGRWDHILTDARPNEMYSTMPPIHFLPSLPQPSEDNQVYECPVYKTTARKGNLSTTGMSTNFVICIVLPCEQSSNHWVLNGTALICNLND